MDGGSGFEEACVFRDDEEAVGLCEGGEVAGAVPGDEGDLRKLRDGWIEFAIGGEEAGESGFGFAVGVAGEVGEDEAGVDFAAAGEGGKDGCGEEVEGGG